MKARPLKRVDNAYVECPPSEATYLELNMPGPLASRILPVIIKGSRNEAEAKRQEPIWSWNGDTERPTLKPSILTKAEYRAGKPTLVCHTWVTDGKAIFLSDCTHRLANQTVDLLEVEA